MNICFLCREYPPAPRTGGIGSSTRDMARALTRLGHRVHVVAPAWQEPGLQEDGGVIVHRVPLAPSAVPGIARFAGQTLDRIRWSRAAAREISRLHRDVGLDIIEAPEFAGEGFTTARRARPPVVIRLHTPLALVRLMNGEPLGGDCKRTIRLERTAVRRAAAVTAPSRALVSACTEAGYRARGFAVQVIPHGIDSSVFSPEPRERSPNGAPEVLFCGRLETRKGIGDLLRALPDVARRIPEARFVFVGADTRTAPGGRSWREVIEEQARGTGIEDRVRVAGFLPREELPSYYRAANVVVAPSPFEAFGLVYLEALACGCPVVGCAAGGFPEIVTDGCEGRIVPPHDSAALADALVEVLECPAEADAMGRRGRTRAEKEFTLERVAVRTAGLYEDVVGRG